MPANASRTPPMIIPYPAAAPLIGRTTRSGRRAGQGLERVGQYLGEGQLGCADQGGVVAEGGGTEAYPLPGDREHVDRHPAAHLGGGTQVDLPQRPPEDHKAGVEDVDEV